MKKSLSLLLALCMLCSMLSVTVLAQESPEAMIGAQNLENGQYVLFGGNKWLVLDADMDNTGEEGTFLLSADVAESGIPFNAGGLGNAWVDGELTQKSVLFCGDSICYANDRVGWAGRIGQKYDMYYVNAGVSGAAVSTVRTYRILEQIDAHKDEEFDYVILHGGVNDALNEAPVGEMTDSYTPSAFDPDTFAGALEELIYYAKQYFTDAKFGYIINFRFAEDNPDGSLADMTEYVEMTKKICDKWDVPYLDMYNNEELNAALDVNSPDNFADEGVHPNAAGYDIITPYIDAWMNNTISAGIDSDARAWAKAYAAETFTEGELAAIKTVTKDILCEDQVFFLSAQEAEEYLTDQKAAGKGWWLRSSISDNSLFGSVISDVGLVGTPHVAALYDARPAINLDSSKITVLKSVDANTLKVALLDESRSFTASADALPQQLGYTDWSINITYAGANTGNNEYVTAMICDADGNAVYITDVAANSESGTAAVAIPEGLAGEYTMYVFSEQRNDPSATDYTSAPVAIPLSVDDSMGEVKGWSLTLADDLILKCHVDVADADAARITVGGETVTQTVASAGKDENGYYIFTANVAAAQMTEQVKVQLVSGEKLGAVYTYTVRQYAEALLADASKADCHSLVKQMLEYGAKAQAYFGINTTDLANKGITVEATQVPTEIEDFSVSGSAEGIRYYGATMVFAAKTAVRYYFNVTGDIQDYTFTVNGSRLDPVEKDGKYYIEVSGINPQDLDDAVEVDINGTMTVTYSPMNYIVRMSAKGTNTLKELLSALYGYHLAAQDYIA